VKVRYFAWMKRHVGLAEEEVVLPADVATVADLVSWLRSRSPGHAEALAEGAAFGAAADRRRPRGRVLSSLHRRMMT